MVSLAGRALRVFGLVALLVPLWSAVAAVPAAASCAAPPAVSAHSFTGVVVSVIDQGRTATVRTDAGRTVTVSGRGEASGAITSVDRTYSAGARYEFHPLNAADPYQDNACTATRQLAAASQPGAPAAGDAGGSAVGWLIAGAVAAVVLAVAWFGVRRRVRPLTSPRG